MKVFRLTSSRSVGVGHFQKNMFCAHYHVCFFCPVRIGTGLDPVQCGLAAHRFPSPPASSQRNTGLLACGGVLRVACL